MVPAGTRHIPSLSTQRFTEPFSVRRRVRYNIPYEVIFLERKRDPRGVEQR